MLFLKCVKLCKCFYFNNQNNQTIVYQKKSPSERALTGARSDADFFNLKIKYFHLGTKKHSNHYLAEISSVKNQISSFTYFQILDVQPLCRAVKRQLETFFDRGLSAFDYLTLSGLAHKYLETHIKNPERNFIAIPNTKEYYSEIAQNIQGGKFSKL